MDNTQTVGGSDAPMSWKAGIVGGLVAGVVFGIMMGMMGMLPMVAKVVRSDSAGIGFIYHLFNSAVIGALFVPIFGRRSSSVGKGLGYGLLWGVIWWFLGPLILMPLLLGMGVQLTGAGMQMALPSLWGHLLYGAILGLLYPMLAKR